MKKDEVISNLHKAMDQFMVSDSYLLINDLSEQSITHRLAVHLTNLFPDYNVDCEYNGDVDRDEKRKRIGSLKMELKSKGLLRESEESDLEKEFTERAVFPDIIIHRRGSNDANLCIIEAKKSTSRVPYDYDFIKLKSYTTTYYGNNLNYDLGVFIELIIDNKKPELKLCFFEDGQQVT